MTHSYFLRVRWKQFYICELHDTTEQYLSAFSGWQNLPLPICWTCLQSRAVSIQFLFPRPTQHQSPTPSPQPAGTRKTPSSLPGPPVPPPWAHHSTTDLQPLFKMAKEREMDPVCSELLYHWCVQVMHRPLFHPSLLLFCLHHLPGCQLKTHATVKQSSLRREHLPADQVPWHLTKTKEILWHLYVAQAKNQT